MKKLWIFAVVSALVLYWLLGLAKFGEAAGKGGNKPPPEPTPSNPAIAYFVGTNSTGTWGDMMVMDADGSNQTVAVPGGSTRPISPNWSPDGNSLVYAHLFNGACTGLHVVSRDPNGNWGTPQALRTSDNQCIFGFVPVWSPDNSLGENTVAFLAAADDHGYDGIFTVKFTRGADGAISTIDGPNLLYMRDGFHAGGVTWSPDGKKLAFEIEGELLVIDMNNPNPPITVMTEGDLGATSIWDFSWAKQSDLLAVAAGDYPRYDLWCVNVNSSQATNLTAHLDQLENLYDVSPSWSPDDSKIIFSRNGAAMTVTTNTLGGCPSASDAANATLTKVAEIKGRGKSMYGLDWWRNWAPLP